MLFQIDNVLKFDVARAVALIISMEEAREALLLAVSKMRVRSTRPGPDDGRRRLQAEEYARTQHVLCELYFFMHNLPHLQPFTRVQVSCRSSGPVRPIDRFADHLPRAQNRQQCYALNSLQCCLSLAAGHTSPNRFECCRAPAFSLPGLRFRQRAARSGFGSRSEH